ncbi:tyrosine-type recombinase/integrase [Vagococcus fluvialis]|nr:tyrosine-type recombinase/integrase [Vagococcus fluvialis]MBO0436207.1 tyrosine-type recombinase/integrase [Vagococcus fluvialis]OTP33483.1 hypothetical protein A5798_000214 [Enterococcus sp. 6C8_DIV0013]
MSKPTTISHMTFIVKDIEKSAQLFIRLIDYLNYRINSIRRRHPELVKLNPHKLRHTFSTLAREGGASIADISLALIHSDVRTTEIYVNTPNIVDLTKFNSFLKH